MLAYVTLGSNDTDKACAFYDAVLGEMGAKQVFNNGRLYFYGTGPGAPMLAVGGPYDEKAATCGNGVMPAIAAPDNATVDKVYNKAIELGAQDEGRREREHALVAAHGALRARQPAAPLRLRPGAHDTPRGQPAGRHAAAELALPV